MPCVDTSKKEAFFEFLEVAEAAYSASGGGPAGILAGAVALVKAGYNMYKNHMDDDDEFQDYFTQDLKNFAFKHMPSFGGASHKPWDRDFGAADKFKGLIQDLLTTRLIDINDLIDMKFINPVDLFNDKIRTNIENYLGVPGIIVRAEIATIKK
jgi:hypothetical protein